jgi:hypothetical protein
LSTLLLYPLSQACFFFVIVVAVADLYLISYHIATTTNY